jgi:hypothetical protein
MTQARKTVSTGVVKRRSAPAAVAGRPAKGIETPHIEENADFVPRTRLIAALVNELARSRVRHRALLDLLERHGSIEIKDYVAQYKEVEERDFLPFVELLLLSPRDFQGKHGDWLAENTKRFGYDGSSRVHLTLAEVKSGIDADAPKPLAAPAKPRPRRRK